MISNSSTRKTQLSSRSLLLSDLPLIGPAMPYDEKGEVKQWNEIFCPLITWFKQRKASFCITSSDNFQSHGKAKMKGPEKKVILFGCLPVALYAPHAQSHVHINHMTSLHVLPSFKYVCPFWHAICNFYFLLSHTVELDDKFYGCFFFVYRCHIIRLTIVHTLKLHTSSIWNCYASENFSFYKTSVLVKIKFLPTNFV